MYYFISRESFIEFLTSVGFDVSTFSAYEECSLWISGNIFILLFIIFALSLVYKVLCRIF